MLLICVLKTRNVTSNQAIATSEIKSEKHKQWHKHNMSILGKERVLICSLVGLKDEAVTKEFLLTSCQLNACDAGCCLETLCDACVYVIITQSCSLNCG